MGEQYVRRRKESEKEGERKKESMNACCGMCMLVATAFASPAVWESTDKSRYSELWWAHPAFFSFPAGRENSPRTQKNVRLRKDVAFATSLAHHGRPAEMQIFLDFGARSPRSSIREFRTRYPHGDRFAVYAFEAERSFARAYRGLANVTFINAAVSTFDGPCFFSVDNTDSAHMRAEPADGYRPVRCLDVVKWIQTNIPARALTVAKLDVERAEFEIVPHLLRNAAVLRLIDEIFVECHHAETWNHTGHTHAECLSMFKSLRAAGLFVHEWF